MLGEKPKIAERFVDGLHYFIGVNALTVLAGLKHAVDTVRLAPERMADALEVPFSEEQAAHQAGRISILDSDRLAG